MKQAIIVFSIVTLTMTGCSLGSSQSGSVLI